MKQNRLNEIIATLYWEREQNSIKNDYGKTCIIGGSKNYPNAVSISSALSSVSGVGFTALCVPEDIYPALVSEVHPCQIFEFNKDISYLNKTYSSLLFGNGMQDTVENRAFLKELLQGYEHNLIIDATGISLLPLDTLSTHKGKVILTPHLGEAARLFGITKKSRNPEDYIEETISFCKEKHVSILLKSSSSILVNEKGEVKRSEYEPTPSLAKAGSGDGLAGYLAGLLAYGDKKVDVDDLILFADEMIHLAANRAGKKYSDGIADILYAKEEIISLIQERKA